MKKGLVFLRREVSLVGIAQSYIFLEHMLELDSSANNNRADSLMFELITAMYPEYKLLIYVVGIA